MNEKQNGISLMEFLILVAVVSCRALAGLFGEPRNVGTGFTRVTARPLFHPALILVIFSLLPFVTAMRILAQNKGATPDLLDESLEELMSIRIDSVYGVSGKKLPKRPPRSPSLLPTKSRNTATGPLPTS